VNRAAAILGTSLLLALAGCAATTAGNGRIAAGATQPGAGKGSAAPPSSSGGGSPGGSPVPAGTTVTLNKVTIPLTGVAKATRDGDHVCLTLVNDTGCSLEVIDIGATRAAGGSVSNPAPGEPNGWWWGSDAPSCGSGSDVSAVTDSTVVNHGFKKVGSKTAAYAYWQVTCQNSNQDFDPRLWWLPTSMIAFREHDTVAGAGAAVDKLLAGVTFGA
jgi:hypothetical protein